MEVVVLSIYDVTLEVCRRVTTVAGVVAREDADLARQLRKAVSSIPLNVAEGFYGRGGNRRLRYATALGSAGETRACLEVAQAMGYVGDVDAELSDQLDRVIRTLSKLARHRG